MYQGTYEHSINSQGRTSIPAKFRETLKASGEESLTITNWIESESRCLVAYPEADWKNFINELRKQPQASRQTRSFKRFLVGGAQECPIDKQGRILIPPTLREYAGLEKDVVLVGQVDYIEIWSKDKWEVVHAQSQDNFADNSQRLADLGL